MGAPEALLEEETIQDLYILHRFHELPNGQRIGDLYPEQKRFLLAAEAFHGSDFRQRLTREALTLRLHALRSAGPIDLLPSRMAETLIAVGEDPVEEGESRRAIEINKVEEWLRGEV